MAASCEELCDTVICVVQDKVQVATVVRELKDLMSRVIPPMCIILNRSNGVSTDFNVTQLTTAISSLNADAKCVIYNATGSVPIQEYFSIKSTVDSRRASDLVVLATDENLLTILVAIDIIFTSAYHIRFKVYGGSYVDIQAMLSEAGEDLKSSIKKDCSEYLSEFKVNPHETLEVIKSDIVCTETFVHGFSTRKGGCSTFPSVSSLNLAYIPYKKDSFISVEENRCRLLKSVGAPSHKFQLAKAVHGNTVWSVGSPEPSGYDAIVCDKPGVVIAAPAADCVTIILADATKSVCAAVHSGWKGTLTNVIGTTINKMTRNFGCSVKDIKVIIGPSIGVCCYEVGDDVVQQFSDCALLRPCIETVVGKPKKHLNLQKALTLQLLDAGVSYENIDDSPSKLCTFCNEDRFFSYRRDGRPFGTHVGFIGLW